MNEELKKLLLTLDDHLEQMYDCFSSDETNLALFHLGAMQAIITWHCEKHGVKRVQPTNQDCVGTQPPRALDKETQETQSTTELSALFPTGFADVAIQRKNPNQAHASCAPPTGQRQFSVLDEVD